MNDKKPDAQMNLPLCQTAPIDVPREKQRELTAALAELLWNAAVANDPSVIRPSGEES